MDCLQGAGTETSRIQTPASHHENRIDRQDNQHISAGSSWIELAWQLLHSQLCEGKRNQGIPRLRFKDTVKKKLEEVGYRQEFLAAESEGQSCVEESDQT